MPFEPDDFYVGMIAYFSINVLARAPHIRTTNPTRDDKPRPFVCYAGPAAGGPAAGNHGGDGGEEVGESYWTCLTTSYKPNRKTLDRRWLRCPERTSAFASVFGDLIVSDARSTFAGPIAAFAACSRKHDRFNGMIRPVLLPEGVAELERYVRLRGGMLPPVAPAELRLARAA
jgi:hypothetical protein